MSLSLDFLGLALKGDGTTLKGFVIWVIVNFRHNWKNRLLVQNQIRKVGDDEILKYFLDSSVLLLRVMRYPSRLVRGRIFKDYAKLANRVCADYYSRHALDEI